MNFDLNVITILRFFFRFGYQISWLLLDRAFIFCEFVHLWLKDDVMNSVKSFAAGIKLE